MADIPQSLRSWSATASSNQPQGSTTIGSGLDDNLRALQATVRQFLGSVGTTVTPSAGVADLSAADGLYLPISGNSTITGFGTEAAGIWYFCELVGTPAIVPGNISTQGGATIAGAAGDAFIAVSKGAGVWKIPLYGKTNGRPTVLDSIAVLSLDQPSGTAGGSSTGTTWTKYPLNTVVADTDAISTLSSNQVTLNAGTYDVDAFAYFYSSDATANHAKLRLRNTTDGTTTVIGGNHNTPALSGSNVPNICWLKGTFTISAQKTFELQYYVSTAKATSGLGVALSSGEVERYGTISFRKRA